MRSVISLARAALVAGMTVVLCGCKPATQASANTAMPALISSGGVFRFEARTVTIDPARRQVEIERRLDGPDGAGAATTKIEPPFQDGWFLYAENGDNFWLYSGTTLSLISFSSEGARIAAHDFGRTIPAVVNERVKKS